jgi:hypothetical protein
VFCLFVYATTNIYDVSKCHCNFEMYLRMYCIQEKRALYLTLGSYIAETGSMEHFVIINKPIMALQNTFSYENKRVG